jgi:hypothetical protein
MSKPKKISVYVSLIAFGLAVIAFSAFQLNQPVPVKIGKGTHISLIGNNLGSRMMNYDNFETELHVRYPDDNLVIRNMCDGGDTPGFRAHASRNTPWAFPGAEKFQTELANPSQSEGHFDTPDQWLTRLKTDVIVSFFGYNESFEGKAGLANYKAELDAFIKWTLQQKYNGTSAPQLVIVSPIAFEDLSARYDLPNGKKENENLLLYTKAMKEVADRNSILFVDAFAPSQKWYAETKEDLTIDGSQLNAEGYKKLGVLLVDKIFGKTAAKAKTGIGTRGCERKELDVAQRHQNSERRARVWPPL